VFQKSLYPKGNSNAVVLSALILIQTGSKLLKLISVWFFPRFCARHQHGLKFYFGGYAEVFGNSES
jgi:hypothetical protein